MMKKIPYFIFGAFILALVLSPLFIKVKVDCQSQYGDCPGEITTKLQTLNTKSLFRAKIGASRILKTDFLVSDFSTQFKLPNILFINLLVRKPAFSVLDKSSSTYLLIDNAGTILSFADHSDLPTLITDKTDGKIGETVSNEYLFALRLIQGVDQMYQIAEGMIQNDTLVVDLPGALRVIFPLGGMDIQVLLGSLRLIYTKVTTDFSGIYSQIDMRYKNPVLR